MTRASVLPFSHNNRLNELNGSREAIFTLSLHAVSAEPFRISPPKAVIYRDLISPTARSGVEIQLECPRSARSME